METHLCMSRESGGARTHDPRLKRPLLYQLSYRFDSFFPKILKIKTFSFQNQTAVKKMFYKNEQSQYIKN